MEWKIKYWVLIWSNGKFQMDPKWSKWHNTIETTINRERERDADKR